MNIKNTITTRNGLNLQVEQRVGDPEVAIAFILQGGPPCVLHWGLRRRDGGPWLVPPKSAWPDGTRVAGAEAVETPFPSQNGDSRIDVCLRPAPQISSLEFVLYFPEQKLWDNNGGKNHRILIAQPAGAHASLAQVHQDNLSEQKPVFERVYDLQADGQLAVIVTRNEDQFLCELLSDLPDGPLLHWGVARHSSNDWLQPPESLRPAGTTISQNTAETPFVKRPDGLSGLLLKFPESDAPMGIPFVLKQGGTGRWFKDGRANFYIPIGTAAPRATGLDAPELAMIADQIIQAEMSGRSWTLMHRFNLCHDLLERVHHHVGGMALLFVWLRFSAIRQLTWQRNYNTKPRELSHAQDRLTARLTEMYRAFPAGRPLIRLMLGAVGRGGEGQRIRDEILVIMHRHHIKEVSGHFTEEWHQKLHNNTTPDDIVICEAYLEFLRSNGNLDRFYERLQQDGVTKARLESFERPIKTHPDFVPHLKDALIHDFEYFLRILKSVHAGTDLETSLQAARSQLDGDTQHRVTEIWQQRNDPHVPVTDLVGRITGARRRLLEHFDRSGGRDTLYLDLALEALLRGAIERNIHLELTGDQLVELTRHVVENVLLSEDNAEMAACLKHWERLMAVPRFDPDWSLHAKSVLDRMGRVLGNSIDEVYQLLQPKAELLGNAFHAEPWTITLFSEEVVRGSRLGFVLSMLLHHLEPLLRGFANLGSWQIISRGSGTGRVQVVETLRSIQGERFDHPTVIIADQVMGDEEVPEGVVAVIAPDVTDIVSHVAVRARNAGQLFATCHDPESFQRLKSLRDHTLRVELNAAGDVIWSETADESRGTPAARRHPKRALVKKPEFKHYAIAAPDFDARLVGGKSLNQTQLRSRLPDWLKQPAAVALPFGVFERVLSLPANKKVAERYAALVRELDGDARATLEKLRASVLDLLAPPELITSLRQTMKTAGLPDPDPWQDAWNRIKQVWASKWNERAFLSRKTNGIAHEDLFMAVLIQPVVEADYAFVTHTVNPTTGSPDELYSEVVLGLGETVVANYPGRAMSFTWHKKTRKTSLLAYPGKSLGLYGDGIIFRSDSNGEDLAGYAGAGLYDSVLLREPREVSLDYSQERLVWDVAFREQLFTTIAEAGLAVAEASGAPQDIEGAWVKGECYVVQTRPQVGIDHG